MERMGTANTETPIKYLVLSTNLKFPSVLNEKCLLYLIVKNDGGIPSK